MVESENILSVSNTESTNNPNKFYREYEKNSRKDKSNVSRFEVQNLSFGSENTNQASDLEGENVTVTTQHDRSVSLSSDEGNKIFWLQHGQWQVHALELQVHVNVEDPIVAPWSLLNPKPPTLFKVSSSIHPSNGHVRRRFRDFVWIRETLVKRYIGMILPEIPKKNMVINEKLLQTRMRGLTSFLIKLVASPFLRTDTTVINFFSMEDETSWQAYKKSLSTNSVATRGENSIVNEGFSRWTMALQAYRVPENENIILAKVRSDVAVLEMLLQKIVPESEKVVEAAEEFASIMQGFCGLLRIDDINAKTAHVLDMASIPIKNVLGDLGDVFANWGSVQKRNSGVLDEYLHRAFKHELNTVKELQRMFARREVLTATIEKNNELVSRLSAEKSALQYSGKSTKVAKICEKMLQTNEVIRQSTRELELMTKGMFLTEIDLFVAEKVKIFQHLGVKLSQASLQQLEALTDVWRNSLSQFERIDL